MTVVASGLQNDAFSALSIVVCGERVRTTEEEMLEPEMHVWLSFLHQVLYFSIYRSLRSCEIGTAGNVFKIRTAAMK